MAGCVIITLTDLKFFIYSGISAVSTRNQKGKNKMMYCWTILMTMTGLRTFLTESCSRGRPEVRAEELEEASERYTQREKNGRRQIGAKKGEIEYRSRFRDLKKRMKDGGTLRILAMEAQELVDYSMPLRCMNYDVQEYLHQLRQLQNRNEREKIYDTPAEKLCRLRKEDRIFPVYTICLYHGMEEWNGSLSLKNMMDFGSHKKGFDAYFKDYAFHWWKQTGR